MVVLVMALGGGGAAVAGLRRRRLVAMEKVIKTGVPEEYNQCRVRRRKYDIERGTNRVVGMAREAGIMWELYKRRQMRMEQIRR